jgi:hypothetical protein
MVICIVADEVPDDLQRLRRRGALAIGNNESTVTGSRKNAEKNMARKLTSKKLTSKDVQGLKTRKGVRS